MQTKWNFKLKKVINISLFMVVTWTTGFSMEKSVERSVLDQQVKQHIEVQQVPEITFGLNKPDWTYRLGEQVTFVVDARSNGAAIEGEVDFQIAPEKMPPIKTAKVKLKDGKAEFVADGLDVPGFLRGTVTLVFKDTTYKKTVTAAFEPTTIQPTVTVPDDFQQFWSQAIQESKKTDLNTQLTPLQNKSSDSVAVFQVEYSFYNQGVQKFYGVLSLPKFSPTDALNLKKYPAIIRFPGAGVAPLGGDQQNAAKGFITLDLYIHGRPVNLPKKAYDLLKEGELKDYMFQGIADRDSFYYKNVILGCVRSVDLIYSLAEFDGEHLGAWGSSQGGALSIITTALEPRIDQFVALCPAMCDHTGYLNKRAGGWPHVFTKAAYQAKKVEAMRTLGYYDVVNFAELIKVPGYFSWGFNDETTPPTSFYSAYNQVQSPKEVFIIPSGEHRIYPEQRQLTYAWLLAGLKGIQR